jgi:predicted RNA-binding protein with PUA-like domain
VYSFDDLVRDGRTHWEGVRNYQARNLLRDEIAVGDGVLFYHSNQEPMAIAGVAKVVREGYPDHTAFDPSSRYYDPQSDPDDPTWYMVDVAPVEAFAEPLTRERLKAEKALAGMMLLQRGARLSVQPVTAAEWRAVLKLAGARSNLW